jgi:hypothetical protein
MFRHFLLAGLLGGSAFAQDTLIRQVFDTRTDTHVEVIALFSKPSRGGYLPVRVKIANQLGNDRSIRLAFESTTHGAGNNQASSSFDLTAPARRTVTRDLLVPLSPSGNTSSYGNYLTVRLSGSLGNASNTLSGDGDSSQPAVLLSESLFTPNASTLDGEISGRFGSGYRGSTNFAAKFDPKQTPDNWLAYSGYDSILMTDADWSNTPSGARNAILAWVRLGGQLAVHSASGATRSSLAFPESAGYGQIRVIPLEAELKLDPKKTVDLVTSGNPVKPKKTSIASDFDGSWPLQSLFGPKAFRYGLFIFVLIVFGILVGPVNLFVFAKSGRRHRLFITTPVISLGASLLLILLIILQDGFGGSGMRRVLMEVRPDAGLNAAFIHQEQFSRTGILTSANFTMSQPAFFSPVPIAESRWARYTSRYDSGGSFHLQPDDGKLRASGDWFQSRSEQGHALSAVVSTRGRIESTDDPSLLLSTFEFPIETLLYLDENRQWHRADNILTGQRFKLAAMDAAEAVNLIRQESKLFTSRNGSFIERAKDRNGHYVAICSQAPGIDTHPGVDWAATRTIITGPLK